MFTLRLAQALPPNRAEQSGARLEFNAGAPAEPLPRGFGGLAFFDEERLAPRDRVLRAHRRVELLTYVRQGVIAWRAVRARGVLEAGEFLLRSPEHEARYHEANPSRRDWAQLFHIGFRPAVALRTGLVQRRITVAERRGRLHLVASPGGWGSSLRLASDALVYSSLLDPGVHAVHALEPGRAAWLQVVEGAVRLDGAVLVAGDGAGVWSEPAVSFTALEPAEVLLLDLGAPAATASK